jgi:hypothetical protein
LALAIFWRPFATALLLQNTLPQPSPPLATAAAVIAVTAITITVPSAVAVAAVVHRRFFRCRF